MEPTNPPVPERIVVHPGLMNISPERLDGWNTSFLLGFGLFSGALDVSFREGNHPTIMVSWKMIHVLLNWARFQGTNEFVHFRVSNLKITQLAKEIMLKTFMEMCSSRSFSGV